MCASPGVPACTVQCIRRNDPTRHNGKMFVHSAELYDYVYKDGGYLMQHTVKEYK